MRRLVATLSGLALLLSGTGATARSLPNYDALKDAKPAGRLLAGFKSVKTPDPRVAHRDERTDSPTFMWVNKGGTQPTLRARYASMAPEQAALEQLADRASLYGVSSFEAAGAKVASVSQNAQGVKVVTLTQEAAGIEVFRQSLHLLLNRNNELVAASGTLSKHVSSNMPAERLRFQLPATDAIAAAYRDLTGETVDASLLTRVTTAQDTGKYSQYSLAPYARPMTEGLLVPARVKQVLFSLPTGLIPAYYVELNTGRADSTDSDYYAYVVSAADGRVLLRNNLTADAAFSYRVFADSTPPYTPHDGPAGTNATPHPAGVPNGFIPAFVPPSLVTLQNAPFSRNDPWLADDATVTTGNNVDAFANLTAPDGYNAGDLRPTVTAPGVFDRTMQFDIQPNANNEQIAAASTHLFFMNNWLHDWFYDSGFDEVAGNAQKDNYGRGGLGGDAIRAQAQDYSGTNNANMSTPADGASPRMRMYLFSGVKNTRLTANTPASVAGNYAVGIATGFGAQSFDTTADVVLGQDASNASGPSTTDACTALTNAAEVAGKFALVDRGACNFTIKAANAQAAGAIGLIVADNVAGPVADLGGTATGITIPVLRITLADGNKLRATIPGLNVRMFRAPTIGLDGTVDNIIVAHEWGHYLSNRLINNGSGLTNNQGGSMGEGWSDFTALLMATRAEDITVPSNVNWNGAYGAAEYATRGISADSAFFGIRRVTYSADMAKNALTFRHVTDGVALPTTAPLSPNGGLNSEVHNSGEVWATMMWDCYVSLLRSHPFQEAQDRMKSYLVNGYKMTPPAPTFLEARDALIAAAYANDPADGHRFWEAFARRGAGVGAVAPDRYSTDHSGVVESYKLGVDLELVSARFADDVPTGSCDKDGIFDNGETGRIIITVRNTGSDPATNSSVTVVSPTPGVSMANGGLAHFPTIPVGETAQVSVYATLRGATKAQPVTFNLALRDENQAVPGDTIDSLSIKANYDEAPNTSAKEDVEAQEVPWESDYDPALAAETFHIVQFSDLNRAFYGPDVGAGSDIRLITPPLNVSATDPLVLTFRHAYDFEADSTANYDGAVIELSQDGGATWEDIGTPLYNGMLLAYSGNQNPLQGRNAIVGTSTDFPTFATATLNLGTTYAGKTVQIRFRIGSDNFAGYTGWLLDDLAFTGITNTPFTSFVNNAGVCVNRPPVADAGAEVTANERSTVSLAGTASDVDGNALTYAWTQVSGPAVVLSGATTLTPSFTAPEVTGDSDVVLMLTVSDGSLTATDTVTVHVKNVNRAPTVNAGLDGSADERSSYTLFGSATDPDGDTLTYLWTQVSGTPVALRGYDKASATFTTPEVTLDETLTFKLTVSDGSASVSDTVDVVIHDVNRAPMVTASSVTVDERSTATLSATASDADGDALTYSWTQVSGPPVSLSGANTATATFDTGSVSADTVLTFRITVSDGRATASQDVVVNIHDVNRAPTVNAGVDGTVNERASYTLTGSASDADGDPLTYQWVQVSGTPVALSGATTATATFTAPDTASGETLTFRLTVSDGHTSASDTVNVVVNNVNRAPVVTAASVTADERSTATLSATASDADGDALTYSWVQVSGIPVTLSGANTATATFDTGPVPGGSVLTFRVTVSDGHDTASQDVVVTIRDVNRAPTVNAGVDGIVNERASYTLTGSATDPDGDTLTYQWVQMSGTPVALSGATTATATFTAPDTASGETLTFRLTVSDGSTSVSDTVNVVVNNVNRAPVVTASSVTVDERSTATLSATASDADGDALTYSWTQVSGTPVSLSGANTATATFTAGEVKADTVLTFRVAVSDGQATTTKDVEVTVHQVNRAPVAHAGTAQSVKSGASASLNGGESTDADGDTLTYHWTQVGGPWASLTGADTATPSITAPSVKADTELVFRLEVSDGSLTGSATVTVTVTPADNQAPVAKARILTAGNQTSLTLDGSASSDPEGDALTYAWEQTGGPSLQLTNATQAVLNVDVSEAGTYGFRLTVTDSHGASNTTTVEATVTPASTGGNGGGNGNGNGGGTSTPGGGCASTGAGAPVGMLGLALISLLNRRRRLS